MAFRCLAHRRGERVHLQSRNQKPLERYFPEVARGVGDIAEDSFVLDGELVLPGGSFETLQLRLHPAESRIRLLSQETPAQLIVFDILAIAGASLLQRPFPGTGARDQYVTFAVKDVRGRVDVESAIDQYTQRLS